MAKESLSLKGVKDRKGLLILIIFAILIIASYTAIYSFSLPDNNDNNYYKGKIMTINESANIIDLIDNKKNIVYSPYNMYTSINYLYKGTDNHSNKQIRTYTSYSVNDYNNIITNMINNNTIDSIISNDITKLYEELINNFYNNGYDLLTVDDIKDMSKKDDLLTLITKINTTYNNILGNNTYDIKYINNLSYSKEYSSASAYQIKTYIDKIVNNYHSYCNKDVIININKLYLNTNYYNKNNILYNDINLYNFDNEETIININNDIKTITNNNIKYYIDETILNNNDNLYINSLIFNMEWNNNFNDKYNKTIEFTSLNNKKIIVDTMITNEYSYLDNGYAKGFKKNFKNNKYSFIAILPNEKDDLTLSHLNLETLLKSEKTDQPVLITIPKFYYQSEIDLNNIYNKIGLSDLTNSKANFNNLITTGFNLDYNKQKISINIAENGTYNSNITTQELETFTTYQDQLELTFNRPFAYIVINNETNDCLLIGKVYNP